jgi:hypothetical protein
MPYHKRHCHNVGVDLTLIFLVNRLCIIDQGVTLLSVVFSGVDRNHRGRCSGRCLEASLDTWHK